MSLARLVAPGAREVGEVPHAGAVVVTPASGPQPVVDLVLLGGGGAAVAVLHRLAVALVEARPPAAGAACPPASVVVVDPVDRLATRPADRTWCSWWDLGDPLLAAVEPAVSASWARLEVVGADGRHRALDLGDLRYVMVRSQDLYREAARAVERAGAAGLLEVRHVAAEATASVVEGDAVLVTTGAGPVRARVALDSRPTPPVRAAATTLLQHFRGEVVLTAASTGPVGGSAPAEALLMDFRVPQPAAGLAFGYRLPTPDGRALVEYTEFSPAVLDDAGYAAALAAYRDLAVPGAVREDGAHGEQGVIVMSDAVHAATDGARTVRLGGAGGAVRGSTGYAFAAMQRQAAALACAVVAARAAGAPLTAAALVPPRAYPRRHAWMDALVLRALADGSLDGAAFFPRLFARNPPQRVLRFLDGASTPREELALMATAPLLTMLRAALLDAAWRLSRAAAARRRTGSRRRPPRR